MTIETLYRKYRPATFAEVRGQDHVISALQNSIKNNSFSHSYLFSGGRGTGKTSIARIFAKELGVSDEDVYEIDAASNRGIGEIRELRDGVDTRPFSSDYKVYIIDEVHMLTKEAFNALLKTLEEPPSHVIFVLATTEKHKILDTIISRCQVFDFNRPTKSDLVSLIEDTVASEKRKIDRESAEHIASLGDGSFRDTLSHLQKVFSYFAKDISFDELSGYVSISDKELAFDFVQALSDSDTDRMFTVYHAHKDSGASTISFLDMVIGNVREVLLLRYSKVYTEHVSLEKAKDAITGLTELTGINSNHLKNLLRLKENMEKTSEHAVVFEIFLFGLVNKKADD